MMLGLNEIQKDGFLAQENPSATFGQKFKAYL